jgi:predicted flap endonuclease-1-like 5' DNA nuclease
MSSWLTFVVGIILGLLFGWLIDLWYRRRKEAAVPETIEAAAIAPELAVPPAGETAAVAAAVAGAEEERGPAPEAEMVEEAPEPPVEAEASQPPDWPAMSERVAEVAEEVEAPAALAPQVAAEMPVLEEGLPPAAVAALAAHEVEERASTVDVGVDARDKLILIEGIGPVYEAKLHAAGVNTFRQLVETGDDRLQEIIEPKSWQRVNFGEWREQAELLAEGRDEDLKALQARLFSRKKT